MIISQVHKMKGLSRREKLEGREHLVVPCVLIVEGVLNGALVLSDEFGRYPQAWNGIPIPVHHPVDEDGQEVSANSPDKIDQDVIGRVFQVHVAGNKLKGEAWIDIEKAKRLGHGKLLATLEKGDTIIEVSTGYYSDKENSKGEFQGQDYQEVHRNIRPDHFALLPGGKGACPVAAGCGAPRVNRSKKMNIHEAWKLVTQALGLHKEEDEMKDLLEKAEEIKNNGGLTSKQFQMLQEMDKEALVMVRALLDAMDKAPNEEEEEEEEEEQVEDGREEQSQQPSTPPAPSTNCVTREEVRDIIANTLSDHLKRTQVTQRLIAHSKCPFTVGEMSKMTVQQLEKLEASLAPADYSGQGAPDETTSPSPLTLNRLSFDK